MNHKNLCLASLVVVAVILVAASAAVAQDATYVSNKQCKMCHNSKDGGEIWNVWKAEEHAKAFEKLNSEEAKAVATKKGLQKPPAESPECLKCHVTGYDAAKGAAPDTILKEDGVQCESCHGPASLHVADGKKYKTTKDASINILAHMKVGNADTCKTCHNDQSPTWNPERYTTKDGKKVGFDFEQAWAKIVHKNPSRTVPK